MRSALVLAFGHCFTQNERHDKQYTALSTFRLNFVSSCDTFCQKKKRRERHIPFLPFCAHFFLDLADIDFVTTMSKTTKKSASPKKKGSSSSRNSSPQQLESAALSDIPLDLNDGADRYLHTSTEFMYRLIDMLCEYYHTPTVTPYMLVLLLEALVPEAPGAAKRQAEAHLMQYGGGACGKKEIVELIKSVQAAGRIANADVVRNAVAEMNRREALRPAPVWLVPQQSATAASLNASGGLQQQNAQEDDLDVMLSKRNEDAAAMGLYAPTLSLAYDLQQQLDAASRESEAQQLRIAELESTLRQQRPSFGVIENHLLEGDSNPVSIVKKATTKGKKGIVKTGRGAVSFVEDEVQEAANAAARSSVVPSQAPPPTALNRATMPTREEVIATARALVAQTRMGSASITTASGSRLAPGSPSRFYYSDPTTTFSARPSDSNLPDLMTSQSSYPHNYPPPTTNSLFHAQQQLPPLLQPSTPTPAAAAVSPWMLSIPALTPYHSDTLLSSTVTHHSLLTATDVARILSDKRPLSVQREEAAKQAQQTALQHLQQQQLAGDGRGRLYGSSYALQLEKRSTMDNISLQRLYAVM